MMGQHAGRSVFTWSSTLLIGLLAGACGGDSRPAAPDAPAGLVATGGNGQVTLSWSQAARASGYNVYYGTSAGVTKASGTKVPNITGTSTPVTGLTNGTTYYFVVTAFNSGGESAESNEAFAQPTAPTALSQADMTGQWRFVALAAGTNPGWLRGTLTVAEDGAVTMNSFQDSAGNTAVTASLFPKLLVDPSGQVRDADSAAQATFVGQMGATNRNKVVATSSANGTQVIALFLKHDPNVSFSSSDINGFGAGGGGGGGGNARRFVYSQITSGGPPQQWEFAQGQIGANNPPGGVQYRFTPAGSTTPQDYTLFFNASGDPVRPGDKASILTIGPEDGTFGEVANPSPPEPPPPPFVMGPNAGGMSDDKSLIVAVTTDSSGASPRYVLRIYQIINVGLNDTAGGQPLSFSLSDLNGTYTYRELAVGANPVSASGMMTIDGATGATSLAETGGGTTTFTLAVDKVDEPPGKPNGVLSSGDAPSVYGKLADFKDLVVLTRTDGSGASRLTIALK